MVKRLRVYEPVASLPMLVAAALIWCASVALPVVGFMAGAYLADSLKSPLRVALGAVIAVGSGVLANRIFKRHPWRTMVGDRLWTFEQPNPAATVPVLTEERFGERMEH